MKKSGYLLFLTIVSFKITAQEIIVDYCFKNVGVITMKRGEIIKGDVFIVNGKIKEINSTGKSKLKAKKVINLRGKYLMPTLSDAHIHLPKEEKEIEKYLLLNLINGVTHLRSMRGSWDHIKVKAKFNKENSVYPKLYLSTPPISRKYDFTKEELKKFIEAAKEYDFVKILSIKNESLFSRLDSLCKIEKIVLGGHFPKNINDSLIFNSNYSSFEHLGGLISSKESFEYRLRKIKEKNIYVCPTLSWYEIGSGKYSYDELRKLPGMSFVSKETMEKWIEKTKSYREKLGEKAYKREVKEELDKLQKKYDIVRKLNNQGVQMLLSPDSSAKYMIPGFGILGEMKLLKNSGLSNYDILKMATKNFAEFFKEDYGIIEQNKKADFLILNKNPFKNLDALKEIEGIFINNNFLPKEELKKIEDSLRLN
nr:hypothetical protein BACY1_15460 [Tenacibaculum mesophilum]